MKIPYTAFPAKSDAAFPNRTSTQRPILTLVLSKGTKAVGALAIVDSGADSCIFPASLARQLGIPIPNQNASIFSGTANSPQIAYFETIKVGIWDLATKSIPITFDLYAGFCETLEHVGLGLLGQDGFFSRFRVLMDRSNSFFEITAH